MFENSLLPLLTCKKLQIHSQASVDGQVRRIQTNYQEKKNKQLYSRARAESRCRRAISWNDKQILWVPATSYVLYRLCLGYVLCLIQVSVPVTFSETFNAAAITWNIDVCVYMHVLESIENLPPKLISAMQQQVEKMAVISSLQVSKWPHCFVFKPFTNDMHLLVFIQFTIRCYEKCVYVGKCSGPLGYVVT